MTCRERLEQIFHELGVPFRVTPHNLAYTAQDVASAEHLSGYDVAKVVMVMADQSPVMIVLPAPHRVDFEKIKQLLGAKVVRLATEKEFGDLFPDCDVGAMPPFGTLYGVPVCVDRRLTVDDEITFNAGSHRETMTIAYADYERLVRARVADLSIASVPGEPAREHALGRS